jgi:hypothetical protein
MMQIQFVDLDKWKDKPWAEMTLKDFLDILKVCDVKFDCGCYGFHWLGNRYKLSRLKSAIYPTNIPDKVWGPRQQNKNGVCKHLLGLITDFEKMAPQILQKIKDLAKLKKVDLTSEVSPKQSPQKPQPFKSETSTQKPQQVKVNPTQQKPSTKSQSPQQNKMNPTTNPNKKNG